MAMTLAAMSGGHMREVSGAEGGNTDRGIVNSLLSCNNTAGQNSAFQSPGT